MKFNDYLFLKEAKRGPHKPRLANTARELQVMGSTGTLSGSTIKGDSQIVHSLVPIVDRAFGKFEQQGMHPQDIEELLLDSLRLAVLYHGEGGLKTSMSTTEFVRRAKERHREMGEEEPDLSV